MDSGFEPEVAPESFNSNDLMQADLEELEIEQPYDKKVPSYNEIAVTSLLEFISNGDSRFNKMRRKLRPLTRKLLCAVYWIRTTAVLYAKWRVPEFETSCFEIHRDAMKGITFG